MGIIHRDVWLNASNAAKKALVVDDLGSILGTKEFGSNQLESILKTYSEGLNTALDGKYSGLEPIFETITYLIEEKLLRTILCTINQGKRSFVEIFIEQTLQGNLENFMTNLNSLLPESIRQEDEEARDILNDLLFAEISKELINPDVSYFKALSLSDLQKIFDRVEQGQGFIAPEIRTGINAAISGAICEKIAPGLETILGDFIKEAKIAIENVDTGFNAGAHKKKFMNEVRKIENESVVRGSQSEELLKKIKSNFESEFDKSLSELIKLSIEKKLKEELESLDSEYEIDNYIKLSNNTYADINKLLKEIMNSDIRDGLTKLVSNVVKDARIICKSRPPKVKTFTDDDGNEYALFKNEKFSIAKHQEKKHRWKIVPKKLANGNVLITFKDLATGKVIEPNEEKRLRSDNPYELSVQEWKELDKQIKESTKLYKEISELQAKLEKTTDEVEKAKLQEELKGYIEKIPFYLKVLNKLKIFDRYMGDYIKDKIPGFDPDSIKITPDIMENLREISECASTQLASQSGAIIIEGEAGVGKNVLIDIFAHFTQRPVFVFACGKKTDASDLTYLWILDENGSKKLNSKIYEAITTPGAILVLDEINTLDAGVIKMLNGLFDKRRSLVSPESGGKDVKALPDVLIFGTMNPVGYGGVQQLPQDVSSRFHFIHHDYDRMFTDGGGVSYSDALKTYGNVNYFWKLMAGNGMRKEDVELYEQAVLDKKMGNKLSKEKQEILERFKPISDSDFIRAWNQLFNVGNEQEVAERFGDTFINGMRDIYDIVLYSNYIRIRHKAKKEGIDDDSYNLPWDTETDELFEEKSFSPRLAIQALEQLHNGNEVKDAKQAVIQTYTQQVSDVNIRSKIVQFFNNNKKNVLEKQLKSDVVQRIISSGKILSN